MHNIAGVPLGEPFVIRVVASGSRIIDPIIPSIKDFILSEKHEAESAPKESLVGVVDSSCNIKRGF